MTPLLRIDSYALACTEGATWQTQWCAARREAEQWRFGEATAELLQPKRTASENNEYLENPTTTGTVSDLDLAYFHLQQCLPDGGRDINLSVSAGIGSTQLESLLGVLQALGFQPQAVLPTALAVARDLASGKHGLIELGRNRSWLSTVEVQSGQARLESVREYAGFGFSQLFTRWVEMAAEAFASRHRFDVHRNFTEKREQLFAQMRQAFAAGGDRVDLTLDGHDVTLGTDEFQARLPTPDFDTAELTLWLLPPLTQTLPLPGTRLQPACCANPAPDTCAALAQDLAEALPDDGQAHRCTAFSF